MLLKEFTNDLFEILRAAGHRFRGEAGRALGRLKLLQLPSSCLALPQPLMTQVCFERFQFLEECLDRVVESFDNIGRRLFGVENVGRNADCQCGGI